MASIENPDYSNVFLALSRRRFDDLLALRRNSDLLLVLPCLCRMTLYPTGLDAVLSSDDRNKLRALLLEFPRTNMLVTFMGVDFAILESDLRKETKLHKKALHASGNGSFETLYSAPSPTGIGHRFEIGDPAEKFRILLSEISTVQLLLNEFKNKAQVQATTSKARPGVGASLVESLRKFEPLDNEAYLSDCCDLLIIFLAERPGMISVEDLCESLVYYRYGPDVIQSIVLNFPDTWSKVCYRLVDVADFGFTGTDDQSPVARKRMEVLKALCNLDKLAAVDLINHCVEQRKFRLAISLAVLFLPSESIGPLISGALAQVDDQQRPALVAFIQSAQKDWPVLQDISVPKPLKRSTAPKVDSSRASSSTQERSQFTEMDEAIFDIMARDSDSVVNLRGIRELWEQDVDIQEPIGAATSDRQVSEISPSDLGKALREASGRPSAAILALRRVLRSHCGVQTDFIDCLTDALPALLDEAVPLHVIQLVYRLWTKIEVLSPRKLYVLTVAALLPPPTSGSARTSWRLRTSHLELCKDPLTILRCDDRVFRCAPILELLLRVLRCYLAASRLHLQRELAAATAASNNARRLSSAAPPANAQSADAEREELMRSLVGAQESAAVQILLEVCLPLQSELDEVSNLTTLREIRCIICSLVHQLFISDPILSKLVHFQTYPSELLPVTTAGIPSMHICLDFIPEMLSQPVQSKRVFAVDLLSCLCEHYAIPKAFGMARLSINVLSTLIGVSTSEEIVSIFSGLLPALLRINRVFPPLSSDISSLLIQVSRICRSRLAVNEGTYPAFSGGQPWPNLRLPSYSKEAILLSEINDVFRTTFSDSVYMSAQ